MRLLLLSALLAGALPAQTPQTDKQEMNRMLDELRAAIRADDWAEASRISIRLNAAVLAKRTSTQPSPLLELSHLQMLGGNNPITRNPLLPRMAKAAFAASEWAHAEMYA